MSDSIKHECGIAFLRLLKPLSFYKEKYGTNFYGLNKMYPLLEKQHNRGQDGAGLASIKLDTKLGIPYVNRERSKEDNPIKDLIKKINTNNFEILNSSEDKNLEWIKENVPFAGELFLGHLRYATFGGNSIENVHPFIRESNWKNSNLVMAGNFNLTNVDEIFNDLVNIGQHPHRVADTVIIMEKFGHYLNQETQKLYDKARGEGVGKIDTSEYIDKNLNLKEVIKKSVKGFDGGYILSGLIGNGDSFILRDPNGIRPAYYYQDDEVLVVVSERPVIQSTFNVNFDSIKELERGSAIICKKDGKVSFEEILEKKENRHCSFERIYFSRGNDKEIYKERKMMGEILTDRVLKSVNYDIKNSVVSYIPNTAETAFLGLSNGVKNAFIKQKIEKISSIKDISNEEITKILTEKVRIEKLAQKDAKIRTFITEDNSRDDLVELVYDITYGVVKPTDNLIIIDDSIVRGTTLKNSIIKILDRLSPKKIIIVSSAPQIRYPDCYGIDMAKIGDFIAFRACIELLKENNKEELLQEVYKKCKSQESKPKEEIKNYVKEIYLPFTEKEISDKIAELVTDKSIKSKVEVIYQTVEDLHKCTNSKGDWYFTGNYPTAGGNKVVNTAFINYMEGNKKRAY